MMQTNFFGAADLVRAVLPGMIKHASASEERQTESGAAPDRGLTIMCTASTSGSLPPSYVCHVVVPFSLATSGFPHDTPVRHGVMQIDAESTARN